MIADMLGLEPNYKINVNGTVMNRKWGTQSKSFVIRAGTTKEYGIEVKYKWSTICVICISLLFHTFWVSKRNYIFGQCTAMFCRTLMYRICIIRTHCDLKVSRSHAKIYENFTNYFLKTKANNKYFIVLKCTCKGLQKSINEL